MLLFLGRFLIVFSLGLSLFTTFKPELLITYTTATGTQSLPENHKDATKIWETVRTHQWPAAVTYAQEMPDNDRQILFSSKPSAEELVIRKKIKKIDPACDVVFIPTAIYELFFLLSYNTHSLVPNINHLVGSTSYHFGYGLDNEIRSTIANNSSINLRSIYDKRYHDHDFELMQQKLNNELCKYLQTHFPEIFADKNGTVITQNIKQKAYDIAERIIKALPHDTLGVMSRELSQAHGKLDVLGAVAHTIELEYIARSSNKALLFRGSDGIRQCISLDAGFNNRFGKLLDSPLVPRYDTKFSEAFNQQSFIPYSLSFGNSLFAGALFDMGACAYHYIGNSVYGYAFSISKSDYINNQCNNLFFVSPLPTLAGLCGCGEFFHSRSKAALPSKGWLGYFSKNSFTNIKGLAGALAKDSCNFLLINRNPIEHASLLSDYFINHVHLIKANVANANKILETHKKAALMLFKQ